MNSTNNEIERRVLGVLLEKCLGQPDYYPMTLKAVVAGCNQKNNRNPVMSVDEDAVYNVLDNLRERSVAIVLLPGAGGRTKKYKHNLESYFGWDRREQAVMAELLLRGPETPGELRTRCSRLVAFENLEVVSEVLDKLSEYDPPFVKALPRQPGQSAIRFMQLLYDEADVQSESTRETFQETAVVTPPAPSTNTVDGLKAEMLSLREEVSDLRQRLENIESQLL